MFNLGCVRPFKSPGVFVPQTGRRERGGHGKKDTQRDVDTDKDRQVKVNGMSQQSGWEEDSFCDPECRDDED